LLEDAMTRIGMITTAMAASVLLVGCPSSKYAYEKQLKATHGRRCLSGPGQAPKVTDSVTFVVEAKGMALRVKDFRLNKLRWDTRLRRDL
jgi:hypothetical protein